MEQEAAICPIELADVPSIEDVDVMNLALHGYMPEQAFTAQSSLPIPSSLLPEDPFL